MRAARREKTRGLVFWQSLRWRFAGPVMLFSVGLLLLFSLVNTTLLIRSLQAEMETRARSIAELAVLVLLEPVWNYHTPGIEAGVDALMREDMLAGVLLTDQYGNRLSNVGKSEDAHALKYLFERTVDIVHGEEVIGHIQLRFTSFYAEQRIRREINISLVEMLLMSLLIPTVVFLISKRVTRPLSRMIRSTDAIARGRLDVCVRVDSKDEIGLLAERFNAMAAQLRHMLEEIRHAGERMTESAQAFLQSTELTSTLASEITGGNMETLVEAPAEAVRQDVAMHALEAPDLSRLTDERVAGDLSEAQPSDAQPSDADASLSAMTERFLTIITYFQARTAQLEQTNSLLSQTLLQVRETQAQMVESEKMAALGSLVAGVAHEINTPLGIGVTLSSHMGELAATLSRKMKEEVAPVAECERVLHNLVESAHLLDDNLQRAAKLVGHFKMLAVDQSHDPLLSFTLHDNVASVLASLGHECRRAGVETVNDCPPAMRLHSHPGAFSQIFVNLLVNSLRHGFADRSSGHVRIWAGVQNGNLSVFYEDDGAGIAEDIHARIYEPFFTTNRQGGNTGLGMNIVYNLVTRRLGGTISCESGKGKGVRFHMLLPEAMVEHGE